MSAPIDLKDISERIKSTPRADRDNVESYHREIVGILDSGEYFKVPSIEHRNLHQQIWISAFMIYNSYNNFDEAFIHFCNEERRGEEGEFKSQMNRFDFWYDRTYIKPYLEREEKIAQWARNLRNRDEENAQKVFGRSLEELIIVA